jgi:hypothetical protein
MGVSKFAHHTWEISDYKSGVNTDFELGASHQCSMIAPYLLRNVVRFSFLCRLSKVSSSL